MTKILTYTPMINATVRSRQEVGYKYYDISDDITDFSITLNTDGCSTFSITLQNVKNKYDGVFTPMDTIVIWLTKSERYQVFSGYITNVPMFTLYSGPVTIKGKDVLWRLQSLYWDSGLLASRELVTFQSAETNDQDGGYWRAAVNVLSAVCGWPADKISIGQIPSDVIEWALSMYDVRLADTQGADLVNKIYEMIQTSGPQLGGSSSSGGAADFSGNSNAEIVWNFCVSQGFTTQAAAAVIGNMQQESGVDPAKAQSGGGPGRGLLQWEQGSDRFNSLCQYASQMGKDWTDIQAQLLYFVQEAPSQFDQYTGHGVHTYSTGAVAWIAEKMTFDQFKALTDIPWATEAFERVYTRASMPLMDKRIAYAQSAYQQFAG